MKKSFIHHLKFRFYYITTTYMMLVLITLELLLTFSAVQGAKMSACFSHHQKSLDIQCRPGYMVKILHTFYGYSRDGKCSYTPGDCILPEHENYPCVGRELCSINLPTGTNGSLVPSCGKYSNYFQVEYECVAGFLTHNICDKNFLTEQSGYIATPRYPINFHDQLTCSIQIQANSNQTILLYIIDMELEPKGKTDCSDYMYFNDGYHSITLCGRRSNDTFQTHGNTLEIELKASTGNSKGFWLYYEAIPKLPKQQPTPAATEIWTIFRKPSPTGEDTYTDGTTLIPIYHDYVPNNNNNNNISKTLPFAAIAGGVIGTLTLILLVLLTLLVIKWIKERRYIQNKERFLEIRNPAFRSSGDFNQCSNNEYSLYSANEYCYTECA